MVAPLPVAVAPVPLVLVLFLGREDEDGNGFFSLVGEVDTFDNLDDRLTALVLTPVPSPSESFVTLLAVLATEDERLGL